MDELDAIGRPPRRHAAARAGATQHSQRMRTTVKTLKKKLMEWCDTRPWKVGFAVGFMLLGFVIAADNTGGPSSPQAAAPQAVAAQAEPTPETQGRQLAMLLEEALYVNECIPSRFNYTYLKRIEESNAQMAIACQQAWLAIPEEKRNLLSRSAPDRYFGELMIDCLSRTITPDDFAALSIERRAGHAGVCRRFAQRHWRQLSPPSN